MGRAWLLVCIIFVLSACGEGKSSRVDQSKAALTPEQISAREAEDRQQAGRDLNISNPQKPADGGLRVVAGVPLFSDANLLVDVNADVSGTVERLLWQQVSGPQAIILDPHQARTAIVVPDVVQASELVFRVAAAN
ncbi:MAG TPA: hypothetical protein PK129_16970, partial [Cellvibrionaceae bacterium]|nr:hypothetical protein [Cellvibrionaceae bacterium]